jgi:hypothetical protein
MTDLKYISDPSNKDVTAKAVETIEMIDNSQNIFTLMKIILFGIENVFVEEFLEPFYVKIDGVYICIGEKDNFRKFSKRLSFWKTLKLY